MFVSRLRMTFPGTWLGIFCIDYTHVCYEVEKKIFLGIKVPEKFYQKKKKGS